MIFLLKRAAGIDYPQANDSKHINTIVYSTIRSSSVGVCYFVYNTKQYYN